MLYRGILHDTLVLIPTDDVQSLNQLPIHSALARPGVTHKITITNELLSDWIEVMRPHIFQYSRAQTHRF